MANTIFVEVYRVDHNDYMHIPIEVQEQYPKKFKLVEVKVEEEEPVVNNPPTKRRRIKRDDVS